MSEDIYHKALMRLAAEATGAGRLPTPDASVTVDNPLCGDRVTLDVRTADGRVEAVGHEVRACVLCQASASLIGRHAPGRNAAELAAVAAAVTAILKSQPDAAVPTGWTEIEAFRPVAGHRSRHACVLLPFDALSQALAQTSREPQQ